MNREIIRIALADDDKDDCQFFKEALEELSVKAQLTTVHDGEQLMELLEKKPGNFFQLLFLDIDMPKLNGLACLSRIKRTKKLQKLPVVMFSTAFHPQVIQQAYKDAAHYYIEKPVEFEQIKAVIRQALTLVTSTAGNFPGKESFQLHGDIKTSI